MRETRVSVRRELARPLGLPTAPGVRRSERLWLANALSDHSARPPIVWRSCGSSGRRLVGDREMSRLRIRESSVPAATGAANQHCQARRSSPDGGQQLATVQRISTWKQRYRSSLSCTPPRSQRRRAQPQREQFTVLYPASFPTEPTKPIPWRVMLIAVLSGICLGGALAFGREYLDRSVHDVHELKDEFELPVLGEVARIQPA